MADDAQRTRARYWLIGAVLAIGAAAIGLPPGFASSGPGTRASTLALPPEILSVDYGRFRPEGARRSFQALRLKMRDPNVQVVGVQYWIRGNGSGIADGKCDFGGRQTGDSTTWFIPTQLNPGPKRLRITAESSSCNARAISESTTARFGLTVHGPGGGRLP